MAKRVIGYCIIAFILAVTNCSQGPTGPDAVSVSVGGTLPAWLFAYHGRLTRPRDSTYLVYAVPAITGDPQLVAHLESVLSAANDVTDGDVRFVLSGSSTAPIKFTIEQTASGYTGESALNIDSSYYCVGLTVKVWDRGYFLTDIPLHELGHFLFGEGISPDRDDIMHELGVSDWGIVRGRFSDNEHQLWKRAHQFPVGSTP